MSSFNSSGIGRAEVEVTANIEPLKQKLAEAEESVRKFAGSVSGSNTNLADELFGPLKKQLAEYEAKQKAATETASLFTAELLAQVTAATAVAAASFTAGNAIGSLIEKWVSGGTERDFAENAKERIEQLQKQIKDLRDVAEGEGYTNLAKDLLSVGTGGFQYDARAEAVKKINEARSEIQRIEDEQTKPREARRRDEKERADREALDRAIERERIASLDGVEKIEAERAAAKARNRDRFGENSEGLNAEVDKRYDHELKRLEEVETKRRTADEERQRQSLLDIEDRKRAYNDLIQHQKMMDREHADALQKALSSAVSSATESFNKAFDLSNISATVNQIAATVENLARQR